MKPDYQRVGHMWAKICPRQGCLGRLAYQIPIASLLTARCSYNTPNVQCTTEKLRLLSTHTGKSLENYGLTQNLRDLATLHASYSIIPGNCPCSLAAWSSWVVKLLLHWDGMFKPSLALPCPVLLNYAIQSGQKIQEIPNWTDVDPEKASGIIAVGSGFFVNIPGSKSDVIFNALFRTATRQLGRAGAQPHG